MSETVGYTNQLIAEVEELRARLAAQAETVSQLRQDYGQCQVYLVEAKAEIARLREALRTYGQEKP